MVATGPRLSHREYRPPPRGAPSSVRGVSVCTLVMTVGVAHPCCANAGVARTLVVDAGVMRTLTVDAGVPCSLVLDAGVLLSGSPHAPHT